MWPRLFPGLKHNGKSFTHEWMQLALGCPPLFRAWLHSGAEHLLMRQRASGHAPSPTSQKDTYELLLMRQDAIVALKNAVDNDRPNTVTDQIIMAAFALALHPHERHPVAASRMRTAPLSNLQWLTRFTDIVILDGHVQGIRHLVQARGGFEKLEMPGLLEGLSTWDLITSTKMLTKPFWPRRTKLQLDSAAKFLAKYEHTDVAIGDFHARLWSEFPHSIMWVFHALRGYSSLLEGYSDGRLSDLDLGYILDLRNLIHYQVLSLPSARDGKVGTVSHKYESFRLAQTIYSLLVLFPVPLTTTPYPELARLLRHELEMVSEEGWAMIPTLLLWILALGGIAALCTPHRLWFVQKLHMQLGNLGIISWEGLVHIMGTLIWLESPCGIEGLILWKEIQQHGHQPLAEYKPTLGSVYDEPASLEI
ncbi:hypothetical protein PEBR_13173 [Penicillium brasilianum]|uniref:Uncharacterized protein n=1 Tax=Penicillium brasilianum TaxID=104259 RepID=A0A1S9RTB6_PENBI|nr:hypothetical protein PEBR_13173 [Penicillium brasilianum]